MTTESQASVQPKPKRSRKRKLVIGGLLAIVALLTAVGLWTYIHRDITDVSVVKAQVARHMILPTSEQPALATVTDPSKLHHQKFFADSRVGDKLLIYAEHNKVILYRPSVDRIVNIGPVDIQPIEDNGAK